MSDREWKRERERKREGGEGGGFVCCGSLAIIGTLLNDDYNISQSMDH